MHIYIYDSFVNEKKHETAIAQIETRITDLGLNGKIIRLGIMNSVFDSIAEEIKRGAKTIIVVGDDKIFNQAVNALAHLQAEEPLARTTPLGFIPLGAKSTLAPFFGIQPAVAACDVLAARRVEKLDLGRVKQNFFLTQAVVPIGQTKIEINQSYSIEILSSGEIYIINLPLLPDWPKEITVSPQDNSLELFIKTKKGKFLPFQSESARPSVLNFNKLLITNAANNKILLDNVLPVDLPAEISLAPEKINLIVGKNRAF
jgi:hypothetical protein